MKVKIYFLLMKGKGVIRYDITVKKTHLFIFLSFYYLCESFSTYSSYDIFMQTRTCSYKPKNMLQPMRGAHKMSQNLNLISSKSQMFSVSNDVYFYCAWDSSFGQNGGGQGLFVGWV